MKKLFGSIMVITASLALSGCAPKLGGTDYSVAGVGEMSKTYMGTILAIKVVDISAKSEEAQSQPNLGALAGAGAGTLLGSQIGKGATAHIIGGTIGALAGGFGGYYAENALTSQQGFQYTVKLDDGGLVTITQGAEPRMAVGQRVMVIEGSKGRFQGGHGRSRVVPATA